MIFQMMVCLSPIGSHVKLNTGPMGELQVCFYQARWPQIKKCTKQTLIKIQKNTQKSHSPNLKKKDWGE